MAKLPTTDELDAARAAFNPYFAAVGNVVHAWNHLQEELAILFCVVTGLDDTIGLAIWHSTTSDRTQRDMLRAAVSAEAAHEDWTAKFPNAKDQVDWILGEANKIADRRNDAIHAPCSVTLGGDFEILPFSFFGNPRAKKLQKKRILDEFEWYAKSAAALKDYVAAIEYAIADAARPWPDRPRMPVLEHLRDNKGSVRT
jgi:hypothetical protein